jgi:molecular chaperone DnaJ
MAQADPYDVLGVSKDASQDDVKKAFRKVVRKWHPDRNPGDKDAEEKCKEAAEAYDILGDAEKRSRFDRFGHQGIGAGAGAGAHFSNFSDIFSAFGDLFGGDVFGGARGGPRRGASYRIILDLEFMEAALGCTKTIELKRQELCSDCEGSGANPGSKPTSCPDCRGRGFRVMSQGFFQIRQPCNRCGGDGEIVSNPCKKCSGQGRIPRKVDVEIAVPAGVDDGMQIRVAGEGDHGEPGAPAGDILAVVQVQSHDVFQRLENDLIVEVPITFSQAALGATIEIPTLEGKTEITIKAGTPVGHEVVLKGKGFPDPTGRYRPGSARIIVTIAVPKRLTERQEELLREFATLEEANVSPQRKSFFKSVRSIFD